MGGVLRELLLEIRFLRGLEHLPPAAHGPHDERLTKRPELCFSEALPPAVWRKEGSSVKAQLSQIFRARTFNSPLACASLRAFLEPSSTALSLVTMAVEYLLHESSVGYAVR